MKKKILAMVLALSTLLTLLSGCGSKKQTPNRLEQIKQRGYITVATEPYFAPNEFIDSSKSGDEKYVGADIELAKRIAKELGVDLKIVPLEFSAVLSSITEGKYDLALSALAYTPERAEAMELSNGYYFSEDSKGYSLLVRKEDAAKYKSFADFDGKKVVCQMGSIQQSYANAQMNVKALDELLLVSATTDGYLMVSEGKADACVCDVANAELYAQANPELTTLYGVVQFKSDPAYDGIRAGMPKGQTELLDFVNGVIEQVLQDKSYANWVVEYTQYAKELGAL